MIFKLKIIPILENDIEEQSNEIFNIKNLLDNEIENSNKTQKANE